MSIERLLPELRPVIKAWSEAMRGGFDLKNIAATRALRAEARKLRRDPVPDVPGISVRGHALETEGRQVEIRIYRPDKRAEILPAVLWLHGGGFCMGDIEADDPRMKRLALDVNCMALSVEYRLAPEHPFPAALDDCYAALEWVAANAQSLGVNPSRIAVAGASAGGNLAAAVALLARDRGKLALAFQLLNGPVLDDRTPLLKRPPSEVPPWSHQNNEDAWRMYLAAEPGSPGVSRYAAPARAPDLSGLPPAYISVGELDPLLQENIEYARRLLQAGVSAELHVFSGAFHGFDAFAPQTEVARRCVAEQVGALQRALHG